MKRFTKSDLSFLKSCGVETKGLRPARECRLECQQIFEPTFAEQRMELARRIAKHTPPGIPEDDTVLMLRKFGIPVTAENWMRSQFCGNPPAVGEVDGEILSELPRWVRKVYDPDFEEDDEDEC